ncbi:VENN motif pre-toxin domain-containing protein, partial [Pantoea agglomerans]
WRKANPGQEPTAADITGQVYQTLYNREMLAGGMGTGGPVQQGISAATAAIQGLAGGDLKAALAGGSAPYLAELIKQKAPDEASRIMAHAAVAGVIAAAQGNSAAAGAAGAATTAAMGEAIKNVLYGDVQVSQLSEQQKQTLVALGTVAAGLAGGLAGETTADTVAGAQAGQNEISNNMVSMGMLQMMQAKSLLDAATVAEAGQGGANEQAALALTKKVKAGLDATCLANTSCVIMAVVTAQQHTNGAGSKTETVPVNDDLTGGKLVNPAQDEKKGTSLVTPDQSGEQGSSNTGNTDGMPDTGGNTTVTPISEQNKDDLAYLAEGDKPANLSPEGAGRSGAFNEAKRQSGIPVSQSPNKVSPNIDKRGNPQPGYIYEFIVQKPGGGTQKVYIRDDAGGHFFGVDDPQNRGSHFNDPAGNHYDY